MARKQLREIHLTNARRNAMNSNAVPGSEHSWLLGLTCQKTKQTIRSIATFAAAVGFLFMIPLSAAGTNHTLHNFCSIPKCTDGANSFAGLIFDANGNLYGTVGGGGAHGYGVVFELTPGAGGKWVETALHSFTGADGAGPDAGLTWDSSGNLYGTTVGGGAYSLGVVFELTPGAGGKWTEKVLHSFGNGSDGAQPLAGVIFDKNGNLYGTTWSGGLNFSGVVFELTPAGNGKWTEKILHKFGNAKDGQSSTAGLTWDQKGNLYGTTSGGGVYGGGAVFELAPAKNGTWTEKLLHSFTGYNDGDSPQGGVIFDSAGNLYSTTLGGSPYQYGLVFRLSPGANGKWTETVLHEFNGGDGNGPYAGLIWDSAGNLYGTTGGGGSGYGLVFKLTPGANGKWTEQVLYAFQGKDGNSPRAGLVSDSSTNLYGTTTFGGPYKACDNSGCGTVFKVTP